MTSPNVPRNAYTDSPEQHPNLMLGSLQLLFWLFFHPSAWQNHLKRIDPGLDTKSNSKRGLRWQNPALWKLLIQAFLVLPVLANSIVVALVLWLLGAPVEKIVSSVAFGVASGLALGLASGVGWGVMWSVGSGVGSGVAWGVAWGVASGVASGVGITINLWLPVVLYPFLTGWNILLYQRDKGRTATKPSFLRWHSAFWDEWQRLPLQGLDEHVLLVMRRNPEEGTAALNYLSTSRQRWAAQEVQIELDARGLERCTDVAAIGNAYRNLALGELNSPVSSLLSSFSRISEDVAAALNPKSAYKQRLALSAVAERLNGLIRELTRSGDKYAVRFRPIANSWYETVTNYVQ